MRSPTGLAQNWSSKSCLSRMSRSVMMPCSGPSISVTCSAPTPCACIIFKALLSEASGGRLRAGFDATAPAVTSARRAIQRASLAGPPSPNACATRESMSKGAFGSREHVQKGRELVGLAPQNGHPSIIITPPTKQMDHDDNHLSSRPSKNIIKAALFGLSYNILKRYETHVQPVVLRARFHSAYNSVHSTDWPARSPTCCKRIQLLHSAAPERHRVLVAGRTLRCRRVSCCPFVS